MFESHNFTHSLRNSFGDNPDFLLKNLPKEDWSEKFNFAAISCTDNFECDKRVRASLYNIS